MKKNKLILILSIVCILSIVSNFSGCIKKIPEDPNTHIRNIIFDGIDRSYRIHIPENLSINNEPSLLFVLHGGGGDAEGMELLVTQGGFNKISDENNLIVVYPNGYEKNWNDGRNKNDSSHQENIDDVGFISQIIDDLIQEFNIDQNKVYCTGISNGAMMSYRLSLDISEKIAAIAPVAGSIPVEIFPEETGGIPVSICIIFGTSDPLVPFEGGIVGTKNNPRGTVISVPKSIDYWVNRNNCDKTPDSINLPNENIFDLCRVRKDTYANGTNGTEVVFFEIARGGHTWPGGPQYLPKILVGRTCYDIDANTVIWDFFINHPKN